MSSEDLEQYENDMELALYREYRDVVGLFSHLSNTSDADDRAALARFQEGVVLAAAAGLNPRPNRAVRSADNLAISCSP